MKVNPHLADLVAHHLYPQTAACEVAGHEAGEFRRHNVGHVVGNRSVAAGQEHAAHPEPHGTLPPRLTVLLAALVCIQAVANPPIIAGHAVAIHGNREQMDN